MALKSQSWHNMQKQNTEMIMKIAIIKYTKTDHQTGTVKKKKKRRKSKVRQHQKIRTKKSRAQAWDDAYAN